MALYFGGLSATMFLSKTFEKVLSWPGGGGEGERLKEETKRGESDCKVAD